MYSITVCSLLLVLSQHSRGQECLKPATTDITVQDFLCSQPYFFSFLPKDENNVLLDNVCLTFIPLPEDPNTVVEYSSFVYCDGSNYVESFVTTAGAKGTFVAGNPRATYRDYIVGYAGCDIQVVYRCPLFGDSTPPYTFGLTTSCTSMGLSCMRKVEEVITNAGLPESEYYILPNKLPNRCVTRAACTIHPNPFYNKLGPTVGLVY
ncbi:uncharacterized protein LOC128997125 [Macrosteles quadrilineatus]|uniref:uncharacterized protein LOC128997125 n=1 Tax=Macrosteles quadrilineatus TaxID=74068 RepID=UPI0023E32AF1|nr:uncharacterized protein LOC128997125 [Macrosteles quadrilineatus]